MKQVICPACGESRLVTASSACDIRAGRTTGRCNPCGQARRLERGRQRAAEALDTRFWSKVERTDGCWPWHGPRKPDGYGTFKAYGRRFGAHRFMWSLEHGPIPEGMHVLHTCDNPPCVNPAHLFLGTHADNMRDMARKGRAGGNPNPRRRNPNGTFAPEIAA